MDQDWVPLAHLWQRRGFMFMPNWIINAMHDAFSLPASPPLNESKPLIYFFRDQCLRYDHSKLTKKVISEAYEQGYPLYRPVYDALTVNDIEVDLAKQAAPAVRLVQSAPPPATVWRWKYWYPAFIIFWTHIFHTENEWLRRPDRIWQELLMLKRHFLSCEQTADYYHYFLAFYERILGVQYDIYIKAPHYVANITKRIELNPAEQAERPILFANAIAYLRERTEQVLQNFQF